jgi:hypothetical protein
LRSALRGHSLRHSQTQTPYFVSRQNEILFYKADINAVTDAQLRNATNEIQQIDPDRLLNTPVDDLIDYIATKYRIDVPVLHRGQSRRPLRRSVGHQHLPHI